MDEKKTPTPDTEAPTEAPDPRRQQVRDKLRELYGDDSADAVRRLLTDLIREEDSGPPN